MSQAKVTEFFSTRKRNRFQDEILLNKQKKTQTVLENPTDEISVLKQKVYQEVVRITRSKAKQSEQTQLEEPEKNDKKEEDEQIPVKKTRGSNAKKKEQLEALKSRMKRLDDKISKVVEKQAEVEIKPVQESNKEQETEKAKPKNKLNRAELKQKIQEFNKKLMSIQNQEAEVAQQAQQQDTQKVAQPDKEIPAYLKFKDLADENLDMTTTLVLPKSYSFLLDLFKGSDTIVKFLNNRDEICTFLKLKMGIQNITKHTFTLKHLGQIKSVYPEAYIYKQEKLFIDFKNDFHLIISPNLEEIEINPANNLRQFTPAVLLKRLNKFKTNLFSIVKKYHQEFLKTLGITDIPIENIKRWHQKFDLENLKDIEESELPKPPTNDSIKCKTGQELLNIAKNIYSSRIQEAIKTTIEPLKEKIEEEKRTVEKASKSDAKVEPKSNDKLTSDQQKMNELNQKKEATYNSLLEKIRQKEKQKALESMIVNSDKEKTLVRYGQYKEAVRFLMFFFQSEKKSTLEFEKCAKKMAENSKAQLTEAESKEILLSMTSDDKQVNLFVNEEQDGKLKKWLNQIKVRNVPYLQMDKSFQLNDLNTFVDKAIEKLKQ